MNTYSPAICLVPTLRVKGNRKGTPHIQGICSSFGREEQTSVFSGYLTERC